MYLLIVSHALCYTKIITYLQSSPKVLQTPLQCWDVIAMLRGYNIIAKREEEGETKEAEFSKVFQGFCLIL